MSDPNDAMLNGPRMGPEETLRDALAASGLAAYRWTIASDAIEWSPNAAAVLGVKAASLASGRLFAAHLDPQNVTSRYDTVMRGTLSDTGSGVPFQIEYRFRPGGRDGRGSLWLEDLGRWFAGADGRPAHVLGTLRRIDERHKRDQQLSFMGHCDPLTGMMNRGRMMEALGGALACARRDGQSCALVIAAINNLAVVKEAYGFEVADEVLVKMGQRLKRVLRAGDAIARHSGSKFGIILNRCSEEDLAVAAERFLSAARDSVIETARGPVWALLSIGALVLPAEAEDPNLAVARAEEALAEARKLPSDGIVVYRHSPERSAARARNAESASEIVRCLREESFRLAFQPVVCAKTGYPLFHEALLRMAGPSGVTVSAGHLIPIAEKLGLIRLIDRAVVQMAVATLARHPEARLSLNLSGTTATDPRWHGQIIDIVAAQPGVAGRLIVEITETVALGDLSETIRFVERLRGLGCSVAIDDFGAGYTSFRNLRALAVDMLKLDGTFCSQLADTPDHQYFVKALIDLGRTFGLKTVAEWVESEADAALLRDWGVDMMQGNLFGAPSLELPWQAAEPAAMPFTIAETVWKTGEQPAGRPEEDHMDKELFELAEASAGRLAEEEENDALFPPPPAAETVARYEQVLELDLAGLRRAIAALDGAFRKEPAHPPGPEPGAEPSFADLVSDTAFRRAG